VIVVDGQWQGFAPGEHYASTDGTQEIVVQMGATLVEAPGRAWASQIEARNSYLIGQEGDWYVVLDADERLVGQLPAEVLNGTADVPAFCIARTRITGRRERPQMRIIRHRGCMAYQYTHWSIYSDDRLVEARVRTVVGLTILHETRTNTRRLQQREAFYPGQERAEAQTLTKGLPPQIANVEHLPGLRYIGNIGSGRWLPGVPARNLSHLEALLHRDSIERSAANGIILYVAEEPRETQEQE
jgi:hypothetical protein